jgi:uncharacterized protein (TIGR00725 family)
MRQIKNVSFFGFSDAKPIDKVFQDAYKTAKLLAENGYVIVNGGGPGVMEAATRGAEEAKGQTIVITFYPKDAPGFEGRYLGNIPDKEVRAGNYIDRMFKLMEYGDVYVIFKGGTGTLSEMATAWALARLYVGHHKPFLLFGKHWKRVISCFKRNMFLRGEEMRVFKIVETPEEVLKAIEGFEKEIGARKKWRRKGGKKYTLGK